MTDIQQRRSRRQNIPICTPIDLLLSNYIYGKYIYLSVNFHMSRILKQNLLSSHSFFRVAYLYIKWIFVYITDKYAYATHKFNLTYTHVNIKYFFIY